MPFKSNKHLQSREIFSSSKEKITFGQLILAAAFMMLAFSSCNVAVGNRKLAEERVTNVQLADGNSILVRQKRNNYREPEVITEFTKQWLSLMFGWEGKEEGIKIAGDKLIHANSYAASLMMETKFREEFIKELVTLIPSSFFGENSPLKSSVLVRYTSEPTPVKSAGLPTWKINIVADWIVFDGVNRIQKKLVPFNKTFTIRAAAIPTTALGEKANSFEKLVVQMRAAGLEIVSIENYDG
jgi:hypothetical protein